MKTCSDLYSTQKETSPSPILTSQTVLITGAGSGIGLETANYFHHRGWNVIAAMRSPRPAELPSSSSRMLIVHVDVLSEASILNALEQGIKTYGKIDALLNCAGFLALGLLESLPTETIKAQLDVNVLGVINTTRAILPYFRQRKSGTIINITGTAGMVGMPLLSVYSASKYAVEESLHHELSEIGVSVKIVFPYGHADTPLLQRAQAQLGFNHHSAPEYGRFVQRTFEHSLTGNKPLIQITDIASAVWSAATDGRIKLRYFVGGPEAHKALLGIRYGSRTDEEYLERVRMFFEQGGCRCANPASSSVRCAGNSPESCSENMYSSNHACKV